ncbi:MAG TPA: hypothetical protein VM580_16065 [Labilithrix sp.]|nr:hypothetical protein [Labilithrix sp.]
MTMNIETERVEPKGEKRKQEAGVGGSVVEALAGVTAVVLSILALAGRAPVAFAAIAVAVTGLALLFEAAALGARDSGRSGVESESERASVKASIGADSIAGIAAIALGVLSLIGIQPMLLLPAAAIVLGAGLLLSAGGPAAERNVAAMTRQEEMARDASAAASGVHVLVGAGAVVLGIIGVLGNTPIVMTLIATLSIGAAQLLTGAAIGGRMASMLRHGT